MGVARLLFGVGGDEGQPGRLPGLCPPPLLSLCAHNAAPVKRFPLLAAAAMLDALSMCPETWRSPRSNRDPRPPTNLNRGSLPPIPLYSPGGAKSRCRKSSRGQVEREAQGTPRQLKQRRKRGGAHQTGAGGGQQIEAPLQRGLTENQF